MGGYALAYGLLMSMEIELKLRVDSHNAVRAKLEEVGGTLLGQVVETNYILDKPDGSLRGQGCGLRVRVAHDCDGGCSTTTLTFKGRCAPGVVKSREEIETEVADASALLRILARMGYVTVLEYEKRRESWSLEGCRVELDQPPVLGLFVEIEGDGEEAIRAVQATLGLMGAVAESRSYVSMLVSHCEAVGISDRVVHLDGG